MTRLQKDLQRKLEAKAEGKAAQEAGAKAEEVVAKAGRLRQRAAGGKGVRIKEESRNGNR